MIIPYVRAIKKCGTQKQERCTNLAPRSNSSWIPSFSFSIEFGTQSDIRCDPDTIASLIDSFPVKDEKADVKLP
jgi:hypothetical protein